MTQFILNLPGHFVWWSLALLLAAAEVLAPGYFLLWIGIGAAATGFVVMLLPQLGVPEQAVAFTVLAFLSCAVYWRWLRPHLQHDEYSDTTLNRRGASLIGRRLVLSEAIEEGRGRVRVGDGVWLATGPDLPAGSEVEVIAAEGILLKVRAVQDAAAASAEATNPG
jgi:membrane protein implicated in regulation of membrane protease activity